MQLWCWIDDNWSSLRIFTYYMPIWVCILLSGVIYFAVGYQVFHQRNQLRNLTLSNPAKEVSSCDIRDSAEKVSADFSSYYRLIYRDPFVMLCVGFSSAGTTPLTTADIAPTRHFPANKAAMPRS